MTKTKIIERNDVVAVYVAFTDKPGGKRRPILVIRFVGDNVYFFSLTSQYAKKSATVKAHYYPLVDWRQTGLTKPTYVDVGRQRLARVADLQKIVSIGRLTLRDQRGLTEFVVNWIRQNRSD